MLDLLVESQRLDGVGDARLVVAIARRQPDALAEVYRRHAGAVLGLARRVLGDPRLSEEVVQEVFLGLWRAPDGFDPDRGSRRSWVRLTRWLPIASAAAILLVGFVLTGRAVAQL
jgi:hypothetical protein